MAEGMSFFVPSTRPRRPSPLGPVPRRCSAACSLPPTSPVTTTAPCLTPKRAACSRCRRRCAFQSVVARLGGNFDTGSALMSPVNGRERVGQFLGKHPP